ncbi:SRPBCC family protein [Nocardioides sp. B-3]|uniref:SRPBCC family protein n=1 Tax=Nocardioides sp. B-3 TaxID=2895565 RepID=UPI0021529482|nr:SRPBCC family protein [Nocardioides sp. B-3]UUZ59478.1 SRPBCC family protein [Nocardioides sp. B-3]
MQLQHAFTVPVPINEARELLLDVERIVPALPGASLNSFEGDSFTGQVKVKIGAIQMAYKGQGKFTERDEEARQLVMAAEGKDTKGAGTVAATIACKLTELEAATRVDVTTDLALTGRPAQFGRGLLSDVSSKIIDQFAANISSALEAPAPVVSESVTAETHSGSPAGAMATPAVKAVPLPEAEPLDLMSVAGAAVAKRAVAGAAAVASVVFCSSAGARPARLIERRCGTYSSTC